MLLEALDAFEAARTAEPEAYPRLVCAITGKGPLKEHYKGRVNFFLGMLKSETSIGPLTGTY